MAIVETFTLVAFSHDEAGTFTEIVCRFLRSAAVAVSGPSATVVAPGASLKLNDAVAWPSALSLTTRSCAAPCRGYATTFTGWLGFKSEICDASTGTSSRNSLLAAMVSPSGGRPEDRTTDSAVSRQIVSEIDRMCGQAIDKCHIPLLTSHTAFADRLPRYSILSSGISQEGASHERSSSIHRVLPNSRRQRVR